LVSGFSILNRDFLKVMAILGTVFFVPSVRKLACGFAPTSAISFHSHTLLQKSTGI